MIPYQQFEKIFKENVYSLNNFDVDYLTSSYNTFTHIMDESEKKTLDMVRLTGIPMPDDVIDLIKNDNEGYGEKYNSIMLDTLIDYINQTYEDSRLDDGGICLKSQLIGKACQMIHNLDMLGVIRSIDDEHPRYLFVDFLDEEEVKIDIDELIISGQKR